MPPRDISTSNVFSALGAENRVRICIYSEATRGLTSLGGSEFIVAVLAEHLARQHDVEILHHSPSLTAEELAEHFGVSPDGLTLRCLEVEPFPSSSNPWKRHREERTWHSMISRGYDLTIYIAHELPPFCHSPRGILMVLFPFFDPTKEVPGEPGRAEIRLPIWTILRDAYLRRSRRQRLRSYELKTSISQFSRTWLSRRWGVDSEVIYPPCDLLRAPEEKQNCIVSVGRFTGRNVTKKQRELIGAFKEMNAAQPFPWKYACAGGLGPAPYDQEYFDDLTQIAAGAPIRLLTNLKRAELRKLYETGMVFWHATGLDEDETARPEFAEHFGIVTVEAMSAGCVPVVIRKGAQPEIVVHRESGFLWDTLEELKEYTQLLMSDRELWARMSAAAVERSQLFSRSAFLARFDQFAKPLLSS